MADGTLAAVPLALNLSPLEARFTAIEDRLNLILTRLTQVTERLMALEDDLEAAKTAIVTLLKTEHDELVAILAAPTLDRTRIQAVVDALNAAVVAEANPEPPPP